MRTFGVEEELLIVSAETGEPLPLAERILAVMGRPRDVDQEFKLEQIETQTQPCLTHEELLGQLYQGRRALDLAARQLDARIAALATSPLSAATHLTPGERFALMAEEFAITSQEQLTCGLHVHVAVESPADGVAVLDRIREWLPLLVALSANSPFWRGANTGYASFRTQAWNRWPTSGPQEVFGTLGAYRALVDSMVATGAISDEGMVYFDARLSHWHPTVEVRVADVCLDASDSALLAVLVRGLVETAAREAARGVFPSGAPAAVLRLAAWRASRAGLNGSLVHPRQGRPLAAADAVAALLAHVAPVLRESGELDGAERALKTLQARGPGERMQRAVASDGEGLAAVVSAAVDATQHRNGGWDTGA
ncbi:putative glutamate--cysteine ligase 2 [Sinomonas cellulolyticus]|uniref:Putative glutamate--cysteine ligase 2 n=1 Tax=Sinomonas cellulolyticus TaxID=2801916 RepID=A0ABS1K287_9MICC|nr:MULTISPECIES: glutamate--cysteine ligase [Sinomonas]MBL0705573.1 glutamate--cysteine ligase [Sinomonas cellulolyticus]GHG51401.1 putative glutamate--cysteine ligase 2 [Sinomonas sp. KCTC 49339]